MTLNGSVIDVTEYLVGQITGTRGRSRETDQYTCGQCAFSLNDSQRYFDPSNTASPYYPGIQPRGWVEVLIAGVQVFGGYVNDLTVNYVKGSIFSLVDVVCLDGFNIMANAFLPGSSTDSGVTIAQAYSGQQITAILENSSINYPTSPAWSFNTGTIECQEQVYGQVDALSTIQNIVTTEQGYFYISRLGVPTYRDRLYTGTESSLMLFSDLAADIADGAIGYQGVAMLSQALLLYNQVQGTRDSSGDSDSPVVQIANNIASQDLYQIRTMQLPAVESLNDADCLALCEYIVGLYAWPEVRFGSIVLELSALSPTEQALVCSLELANLVTVSRTPIPGVGSPETITILSQVEQLSWALDVSNSTYTWTMSLGSPNQLAPFQLDSSTYGLLDTDRLNT
jgi:hypothetical protein